MNTIVALFATTTLTFAAFAQEGPRQANPEAKLHRFSTTIEKERPELNDETKRLIAAYRRDPSDANRAALRRQVAANYDAVVARKKAKLDELKRSAKHQSKIDEMQVIVDDSSPCKWLSKTQKPTGRHDGVEITIRFDGWRQFAIVNERRL